MHFIYFAADPLCPASRLSRYDMLLLCMVYRALLRMHALHIIVVCVGVRVLHANGVREREVICGRVPLTALYLFTVVVYSGTFEC